MKSAASGYSVAPLPQPLCASVRVPGSKSLTNRALLIAALAEGATTLTNALESDDSARFIESLQRLGFDITPHASRLTVQGLGGRIPASQAELFVGNAGTAARFLTAMLVLGHGEYVLDGDARMRERPIGDLVDALRQLGADISGIASHLPGTGGRRGEVCPPVRIVARGLPSGRATVRGDVSSQFLSGLLMVAPYARGPIEIEMAGELNSKPYVEMTLAIMRDFGVTIQHADLRHFSVAPQRYRARAGYAIESDASAASYFFAAPAVCGGTVRVENITRRSKQGDVAFLDVLAQMGCLIAEGDDWIAVTGPETLRGVEVDMRDIPDTAQTLAAIAPFADSPTTIRGIASARVKETDRVAAMCAELARLGVTVEEYPDGLKIYPTRNLRPANIQTYNDHRMAMAFALTGLRAPGVVIEDPGCVSKTFPDYFDVLEQLGSSEPMVV
jgi:3-phosphoshikimate 1-carboxyvinyltransferase